MASHGRPPEEPGPFDWLVMLVVAAGAMLLPLLLGVTSGKAVALQLLGGLFVVGAFGVLASLVWTWARGDEEPPSMSWAWLAAGPLVLAAGLGLLAKAPPDGHWTWGLVGWIVTVAGVAAAFEGAGLAAVKLRRGSEPRPAGRVGTEFVLSSPVLKAFARSLVEHRARSIAGERFERVEGRTAGGRGVSAEIDGPRFRLAVEVPREVGPFDLTAADVPPEYRHYSPHDGELDAEAALRWLFGRGGARRVWIDGTTLRLELGREPELLAPCARELVDLLERLPELLEPMRVLVASASPSLPRSERPGARLLAAMPRCLERPRVERLVGATLVTGRRGGRNVTLRVDGAVTLSFDLPFRAAFDLGREQLPPEVVRALEGGPAPADDPEAALVTLFGPLGCQRLRAHARRVHATFPIPGGDAGAWARQAASLVERLDGLVQSPVIQVELAVARSGAVCPYCRDAAAEGDAGVAACEACGTVHHADCLEEAGGCTVLGCGRSARRSGRVRVS